MSGVGLTPVEKYVRGMAIATVVTMSHRLAKKRRLSLCLCVPRWTFIARAAFTCFTGACTIRFNPDSSLRPRPMERQCAAASVASPSWCGCRVRAPKARVRSTSGALLSLGTERKEIEICKSWRANYVRIPENELLKSASIGGCYCLTRPFHPLR
jgi:hypothetical protein